MTSDRTLQALLTVRVNRRMSCLLPPHLFQDTWRWQSCRKLETIGRIDMVQTAVTIWILSKAAVQFAKAFRIIKKTNHDG